MDKTLSSQSEYAALDALVGQLCTALEEATGGQIATRDLVRTASDSRRLDLVLTLLVGGERAKIAVEFLRHAYPRDIRAAVWQLGEHSAPLSAEHAPIAMVVAESLSPGAKKTLRDRGVGYFESNGSLFLRWRHWLIDIERPQRAIPKSESISLFTDAREMVVHALLKHRYEWFTGGELAEIAQTSSYTCSVVLQELTRREWCESKGAGRSLRRRLAKPGDLLDAWADQWVRRKEKRSRWYVFPKKANALLTQLSDEAYTAGIDFPWAFSGTAAANMYAPLLTSVDTAEMIVPPGSAEKFAEAIKLKPADKGYNVTLVEREGASLMFREFHSEYPSYFASPFVLYLDLLDGRGRNKELAAHVRERMEL
jgi:hypothetical protein